MNYNIGIYSHAKSNSSRIMRYIALHLTTFFTLLSLPTFGFPMIGNNLYFSSNRKVQEGREFLTFSVSSSTATDLNSYASSVLRYKNVTFSEWAVAFDCMQSFTDFTESVGDRINLSRDNNNNGAKPILVDAGRNDSYSAFVEFCNYNSDFEIAAGMFRRNIALRANRVLHPARNAQIFTALINLMISANL